MNPRSSDAQTGNHRGENHHEDHHRRENHRGENHRKDNHRKDNHSNEILMGGNLLSGNLTGERLRRETAEEEILIGRPRPEAILFDAAGTLIHPDPDVISVYHRFGSKHGSTKTTAELMSSFTVWLDRIFRNSKSPNCLKTSEPSEKQKWFKLVQAVFDDVQIEEGLFESLWNYFSQPDSWTIYSDVLQTWKEIVAAGFQPMIASNFDQRLRGICADLPPLDRATRIFLSTEIGFAKPAPGFFSSIEAQLQLPPESIMLVGDDLQSDVLAAVKSGWQACWINRKSESSPTSVKSESKSSALTESPYREINSLREIANWIA